VGVAAAAEGGRVPEAGVVGEDEEHVGRALGCRNGPGIVRRRLLVGGSDLAGEGRRGPRQYYLRGCRRFALLALARARAERGANDRQRRDKSYGLHEHLPPGCLDFTAHGTRRLCNRYYSSLRRRVGVRCAHRDQGMPLHALSAPARRPSCRASPCPRPRPGSCTDGVGRSGPREGRGLRTRNGAWGRACVEWRARSARAAAVACAPMPRSTSSRRRSSSTAISHVDSISTALH
jgi:hypothetical protein